MWTPDELAGGGCLGDLLGEREGSAGVSPELCRPELLNPSLDLDGDGIHDSARLLVGESVIVATDYSADGYIDTVASFDADGTYTVWNVTKPAASEGEQWQINDEGLLA